MVDLREVLQAVQELLEAPSAEAMREVMQKHPALLEEETVSQMRMLAEGAKIQGEAKMAQMLASLAAVLEQVHQAVREAGREKATPAPSVSPSCGPKVPWAQLTRQYLALRKEELLAQAVAAAEQAGEEQIARLLRAFRAKELQFIEQQAPELVRALLEAGRREEAWTVDLVRLHTRAVLAEHFMLFPLPAQQAALEEGLKACKTAIHIAHALADEPCIAFYYGVIGNGCPRAHAFEEAEQAYREAHAIYARLAKVRPEVYEPDVAMTLNNLGSVLAHLRRFEDAEQAYREALAIRRRLAKAQPEVYEPDVAMTLNNLGSVLDGLRRFENAEQAYREAKKVLERHDIPDRMVVLLSNMGRLWMAQERWEEAAAVLREAMENVERLRAEALILDRRMRILRENVTTYERLLICLMRLRRYGEALEVAEQGKSRTLVDLLTLKDLRPRAAPPEVVQEYERMLFKARALEDALKSAEGGRRRRDRDEEQERGIAQQRQELLQATSRLRELAETIRQHDPDFLPHAKPLKLEEIVALSNDAGATLVLFRVTERGSFVFLVFPNGTTDVVQVPDLTTDTLHQLVVKDARDEPGDGWVVRYYEYQRALASGIPEEATRARERWLETMDRTLGVLYQGLLKHVHERLKQEHVRPSDVVFVPNRGLAILPLHACWWEQDGARKYLVDEFTIRYAPSLSVFKRCLERERRSRPQERLLAITNPVPPGNLLFSKWECEEIERLLGSERCLMLWREKATEKEVMRWMSSCHYIHFSCHGQYRLDAPLDSLLHLAAGDAPTLGAIFEKAHIPRKPERAQESIHKGWVVFCRPAKRDWWTFGRLPMSTSGYPYASCLQECHGLWKPVDSERPFHGAADDKGLRGDGQRGQNQG